MKKSIAVAFAAMMLLTGCGQQVVIDEEPAPSSAQETSVVTMGEPANHTLESIPDTSDNTIVITLRPDCAPLTCENFENLVNDGFYNGLTFHRVVDDFMAQGGDPAGNGTGGSGVNVKGEFANNGVENNLYHKRGVVSMARSMAPDSASCQFFICYTDSSFLDGDYAAFGEVTEGMNVVDDFLKVPRSMGNDNAISAPDTPITIKSIEMIDDDADGNPRAKITMEEFLK